MLCGTVLHAVATAICEGFRTFPVDPLLVQHPRLFVEPGALARQRRLRARECPTSNLIDKIMSGWTVALPYCRPLNVHWIPVLMWMESGVVHLTYLNSCPAYDIHARRAITEAKTLLSTLQRNPSYNVRGVRANIPFSKCTCYAFTTATCWILCLWRKRPLCFCSCRKRKTHYTHVLTTFC